jgi:CDP-paratose synthetase
MNKKVLLTGVTGFLGSYLAKSLLQAGYDVIGLKRKSSSLQRIESISSNIILVNIDELDYDELFKKHGKIDVIFHTATCYGRNGESVSDVFHANTEFPLRLLDAGARAGVGMFFNTDTILDKYLNLYSLSKNQLLQWGKFFSANKKIRFSNLRLEHFYGPNDDKNKFTSFVVENCLRNVDSLKLTLGDQKRDFIYIDDVVSAYQVLLEKTDGFESYFNEFDIGSGKAVSIRDFVELAHKLTNSSTKLLFGAYPYRDEEVMHSEANISKLIKLGWHCKYDIESGLKKSIYEESN